MKFRGATSSEVTICRQTLIMFMNSLNESAPPFNDDFKSLGRNPVLKRITSCGANESEMNQYLRLLAWRREGSSSAFGVCFSSNNNREK